MTDNELVDRKDELSSLASKVVQQIQNQKDDSIVKTQLIDDRNQLQNEVKIIDQEITNRLYHHDTNKNNEG